MTSVCVVVRRRLNDIYKNLFLEFLIISVKFINVIINCVHQIETLCDCFIIKTLKITYYC